jgi:hypothetical protein
MLMFIASSTASASTSPSSFIFYTRRFPQTPLQPGREKADIRARRCGTDRLLAEYFTFPALSRVIIGAHVVSATLRPKEVLLA